MDALLGIFGLYILMAFAGIMPSPMFFFAVWLDNRERREHQRVLAEHARKL